MDKKYQCSGSYSLESINLSKKIMEERKMNVVCPVCETDEDFFVIEERETFSVFFCNNCEKEVIIRSYPKHTSIDELEEMRRSVGNEILEEYVVRVNKEEFDEYIMQNKEMKWVSEVQVLENLMMRRNWTRNFVYKVFLSEDERWYKIYIVAEGGREKVEEFFNKEFKEIEDKTRNKITWEIE